jgi:flagellar basal-body rod modification protein FlgD
VQNIGQIVTGEIRPVDSAVRVAHAMTTPRAVPSGNAIGTNSSTADGGSSVSANDFLTLLVAEMKNQDPTQPTDPNAYISQMVDVNSLQQLIGINQGVSSLGTFIGANSGASVDGTGGTAR